VVGSPRVRAHLAIAVVISAACAPGISAGCAPQIDGPVEHQRAIDRDDGARLAAQLTRLPGVTRAEVVLHHALRDPLAVTPPRPAAFSAVLVVDDRADAAALRARTVRLVRAALPELAAPDDALAIEVHPALPRAALARVGPFWVDASSRAPLRAALGGGCLAIAALAGALAHRARQRRGNSAQ
jgi:hypothetical protein